MKTRIMRMLIGSLLIFLLGCQPAKQALVIPKPTISLASLHDKYKIVRIDSIQHVYLIYVKKDCALYKIVSRKDSVDCPTIKVGEEYPMMPLSIVQRDWRGVDISVSFLHVAPVNFYGVPIRFEGDSIRDIYRVPNLRGLCLQF